MQETPRPATAPVAPAPGSIADDRDRSLDPASVTVTRIAAAIWWLILAVPLVITVLLVLFFSSASPAVLAGLGAGAAAFAALVFWSLYWPAASYRHASYRVAESGLWIRRGVIWRSEISVPRSRVQHTDVSQGPLQRRFGIATLVLHTAGTQHAAVSLPGLPHEAALAIRDYLIEAGEGDAV